MVVVLFRSKLVEPAPGYSEMANEMEELARTMPGFIDVKAYKADDGERLTLVWWQDEATMKIWREDQRHRVAQRAGREQWYQYYKIDVAEVVRARSFERESEQTDRTPKTTPTPENRHTEEGRC